MSWAITAAVVTAVATGYSIDAQQKSAKAQENELERKAEQERISAQGREIERRQRLNKALAANTVSQSMSDIKAEGTPSSIALESAKQIAVSEGAEALAERLRQSQLARQAKNIRSAANAQSVSTLLSGASKISTGMGSE